MKYEEKLLSVFYLFGELGRIFTGKTYTSYYVFVCVCGQFVKSLITFEKINIKMTTNQNCPSIKGHSIRSSGMETLTFAQLVQQLINVVIRNFVPRTIKFQCNFVLISK